MNMLCYEIKINQRQKQRAMRRYSRYKRSQFRALSGLSSSFLSDHFVKIFEKLTEYEFLTKKSYLAIFYDKNSLSCFFTMFYPFFPFSFMKIYIFNFKTSSVLLVGTFVNVKRKINQLIQ